MKKVLIAIVAIFVLYAGNSDIIFAQDQKYEVEESKVILKSKVLFELSKSDISLGSAETLNEVISLIKLYTKNYIIIEGHADSTGERKFNQKLSEDRARAVFGFFAENGISAERMKFYGFGSSRPAAPNETAQGQQQNRRVEIKIMKAEY